MTFHIITLFPKAFDSYFNESIIKRAIKDKKIFIKLYDPKNFNLPVPVGKGRLSKRIDDKPYGGGPGMVSRPEPVIKAIEKAKGSASLRKRHAKILFLSPGGKQFTNIKAREIIKKTNDVIIICGRYEGVDARVKKVFKMEDISIGPFVLTGGGLPAMIIVDAIARQVEGVLGNLNSLEDERVASNDVYTRPITISHKGKKYRVPKVLLSGNHKEIDN